MHFAHFFCICINDYDDDYCSAKQIDGVHHLFALNLMNYYFAKEEWMCLMKILDKTLLNYIFNHCTVMAKNYGTKYRFSLSLLSVANNIPIPFKGCIRNWVEVQMVYWKHTFLMHHVCNYVQMYTLNKLYLFNVYNVHSHFKIPHVQQILTN